MKHKLIMENWRRFQDEQDDRLIVEGKRKSFESLMLEVDQGRLSCVTVAIALSEQVDRQIALLEKQLNENFLKNMAKKAVNKIVEIVIPSIKRIAELILSATKNTFKKVLSTCLGIINKISKGSKFLLEKGYVMADLVARTAVIAAFGALLSFGVNFAQADTGFVGAEELKTAMQLEADNVKGKVGRVTAQDSQMDTDGIDGLVDVERFTASYGAAMDQKAIETIQVLETLLKMVERKGSSLTKEEVEQVLSKIDAEIADWVTQSIDNAGEFSKIDPEGAKLAADQSKQIKVVVSSIIRSIGSKVQGIDDMSDLGQQTQVNVAATEKSIERIPQS